MIATCPHCRNGFYIAGELAGKVLNCSRCSKPVRAPDRRAGAPVPPADDGIPLAILEETKSEIEERLKAEVEAKSELQKKLAAEIQARAEIEKRLQAQLEARNKAEDASGPAAEGDIENEIKAEIAARVKAEVQLEMEIKARKELEEKLKAKEEAHAHTEEKLRAEIEARSKAQMQVEHEREIREDLKAKLNAQTQARAETEKRLLAEGKAKTVEEPQAKDPIRALLEVPLKPEEAEVKSNAEKEPAATKAGLKNLPNVKKPKVPMDLRRGLRRLVFIISIGSGALAGLIAFRDGYILNSHFDRPVSVPFASKPIYLPINLIVITIAGFVSVWVMYFLVCFIIKGFREVGIPKVIKAQKVDPPVVVSSESSEMPNIHEVVPTRHVWRSS